MQANQEWEIKRRSDYRFDIVSKESGTVIDDAQGYGYKTYQNAAKAAWYKFSGGKKKITAEQRKAREFWKKHPDVKQRTSQLYNCWLKEIARGEIKENEVLEEACKELDVQSPGPWILKYLDIR